MQDKDFLEFQLNFDLAQFNPDEALPSSLNEEQLSSWTLVCDYYQFPPQFNCKSTKGMGEDAYSKSFVLPDGTTRILNRFQDAFMDSNLADFSNAERLETGATLILGYVPRHFMSSSISRPEGKRWIQFYEEDKNGAIDNSSVGVQRKSNHFVSLYPLLTSLQGHLQCYMAPHVEPTRGAGDPSQPLSRRSFCFGLDGKAMAYDLIVKRVLIST